MADAKTVRLASETWTDLSGEDITSTFGLQSQGYADLWVKAGDDTAPTDFDGAFFLRGAHFFYNSTMAALFPGVTGATRIWAWSDDKDHPIYIAWN